MTITIKNITTQELLNAPAGARLAGYGSYDEGCSSDSIFVGSRPEKGGEPVGFHLTCDELTVELATRPHIPGKAEGKLLRRLMSETGWTADALRAHPKFGEQLADAKFPNRRMVSAAWAKAHAPLYGAHFGRMFKIGEGA